MAADCRILPVDTTKGPQGFPFGEPGARGETGAGNGAATRCRGAERYAGRDPNSVVPNRTIVLPSSTAIS